MLGQLIASGIVVGGIYTLMALGMTVLYRSTTVVNFCHGEFFMVGAFAVLLTQSKLGWLMGASIVFSLVLMYSIFNYTRSGKVIQAASQTPRGAALVGINVPRLRNIMWGVGAVLGAMAGILIAPTTLVYPDMGGHVLIRAFAAMTLGGFGSLPGAVIGSMSLGVIENLLGGYVSSALVEIAAYLVIIAVLIVRPQGIMGEWRQGRG